MFGFDNIDLSLSLSPLIFFLALIILGLYTFYIYRYTVPEVNAGKKILLVFIRFTALLLILFIIFEPILSFAKKEITEPVNLVIIDNSRSIKIDDGTDREEKVRSFIDEAADRIGAVSSFYTFGNRVNSLNKDSIRYIDFNEGATSFSSIISSLNESRENISSVVVISDGVITSGSSPVYSAEKLNVPFFTIGVGDTTGRNDIEIRNVLFNEYIYAGSPTSITASLNNRGYSGRKINAALYEDNRLIAQTEIQLTGGTDNLSFAYTPERGGEKKLTLTVSELEGEFTFANNRKVFYVNVLDNKLDILVLSGSPSPDLTFIKNSLALDENINIKSVTQISTGRYIEKQVNESLVDSADILFLVGFPTDETDNSLMRRISDAVNRRSIPFFLLVNENTSQQKLREIEKELSYTAGRVQNRTNRVQPDLRGEIKSPLLTNNAQNPAEAWHRLPPVLQPDWEFKPKAESEVLVNSKLNNMPASSPLIITRKLGSKRSVTVLAGSIWKWKLQTSVKDLDLFDSFLLNSVKWLNTSEDQKQVNIRTTRKVFSAGEEVEFNAQVYDATFNPAANAEVEVIVRKDKEEYKVLLNSLGGGLYEGTFQPVSPGDYSFTGYAASGNTKLGEDKGNFNVGEVDIEMTNPSMNIEMLSGLARNTGGEFYIAGNHSDVFDRIKETNAAAVKEKQAVSELNLWSNEILLIMVILLFAFEWFIRKRTGML